MAVTKHRVFISYHHADQKEVNDFVREYSDGYNIFTSRMLGMSNDIINSMNPQYVMTQIRNKYLLNSTVTIVLLGRCTWARRYVDWEIKSSLRKGQYTPNGLLGIVLPSMRQYAIPPDRLGINLPKKDGTPGYARWYTYPTGRTLLRDWIEDAFESRTTRADLIVNSAQMFKYNRTCQ